MECNVHICVLRFIVDLCPFIVSKITKLLLFLQNENTASNRQLKYGSTAGVVASRDAAGKIINFISFKNGSIKKDKFPSTYKLIGLLKNERALAGGII